MGNHPKMADRQRTLALPELGRSYWRRQRKTDVRPETVAQVRFPTGLKTGRSVHLSFFTDMTHLEGRLFTELTHPIVQVIDPPPGAPLADMASLVQLALKEAGPHKMARRRVTVRDIAEILEHWQAGRSFRAMAKSLGASRPTLRKYVHIAQSHGYRPGQSPPAQGWKAFLQEVAPEVFDTVAQSRVFAELRSHRVCIEKMLTDTSLLTAWQRLRDEQGLTASYSSFRRYVQKHLPGGLVNRCVNIRQQQAPLPA